jgi:hypothetical protein
MVLATVFFLLLLASIALLIIAQKNPKKAMFWKNEEATRKQATLFYAWAILISTSGWVAMLPGKSKETEEKVEASETERRFELARSCDTNYSFISNTELYLLNQKGFFVGYSETSITNEKEWFNKPWMVSTYKQVGPKSFEEDKTKKLALYTQVEVQTILPDDNSHYAHNYLVVIPVGSTERYIIDDHDFTLKDVTSCSFLQKAKNKFYTLAEYIPTPDEKDRPVDETNGNWIDVPEGAYILVKEYRDIRNTFFGEVYSSDGRLINLYAHFKPETLREIKR